MNPVIRIGTRDSELALWQATTVKNKILALGAKAELVPIKSEGDILLNQPLYELGITGIFTKTLDIAMLNGTVDIAVHSLKDVPTALPKGIVQAAVLERASAKDILIHKELHFLKDFGIIATGSLRRKAQWLNRYPKHQVVDLRGNVNTRLDKLRNNSWNAAIFAEAGLNRIQKTPVNAMILDWMIPAPGQGAMMVAALEKDTYVRNLLSKLEHTETALCVAIERDFLKTLEGGCTAPIGAIACIKEAEVHFKGALFSLDGTQKKVLEKRIAVDSSQGFGVACAHEILQNGGAAIMQAIRNEINQN